MAFFLDRVMSESAAVNEGVKGWGGCSKVCLQVGFHSFQQITTRDMLQREV